MYGKRFLSTDCSSDGFLNAISYSVELSDLLSVKKTCAYNINMPYVPVILEIMVQRLRDLFRGSYLLQLWDSAGQKVYEKPLKYDVISWNIQHDYLIFKLDPREEEKQWIYIIDCANSFKQIKVANFMPDDASCKLIKLSSLIDVHLGISQGLLHYANNWTIKLIDIKVDKEVIEPAGDEILTYEINKECKLHGFFENGFSRYDTYMLCMIETTDNQIDFNRLYKWERDVKISDLEFYQYREVVPRAKKGDPIKKFSQVILKDSWQFGVALKASGQIDIYWNHTMVQQVTPDIFPDCIFDDVTSNYNSLFLKQTMANREQRIYQLNLTWDARIGMDTSIMYPYTDQAWDFIKYVQIRHYAKVFTAMTLVDTTFFVAYNNIVSTFDIIRKLWMDHYLLDQPIIELLRNQDENETYFVGIYLQNGKILPIVQKYTEGNYTWEFQNEKMVIAGENVVKIITDSRDISSHYIMIRTPKGPSIIGYQGGKARDLTDDTKFKESQVFARFYSNDMTEDFITVDQSNGTMRVFQNGTAVNAACAVNEIRSMILPELYLFNDELHSVVEQAETQTYFFFDKSNVYIFNKKENKINTIRDMNIVSIQLIDNRYIYCLKNDGKGEDLVSGFYFYDLMELSKKVEESVNFRLKKAMVGRCTLFDYYKQDERIAYMESYERFKIVPLLHRNTINLIGMNKRQSYVAFKRSNDTLIALDTNNRLTSWNICTGKVKGQYKLKVPIVDGDFQIYKMDATDTTYSAEWYQPKVLLIDAAKEHQIDENEYFGDRLYLSLKNNTSYVSMEEKFFREFKVIEIINETEVKEHYSFIHPRYAHGTFQRIYFSNDLEYMLERLINQRVFLYKKEPTDIPGRVKWRIIRRIKQFPMDISDCTIYNYLFSPDLMNYLDFDKSENCFLIKKSIDQSVLCTIPTGLMNPETEKPGLISKRFRWIDNQTFKIINNEGIEKIVDIKNGFQAINQDTVPMLSLKHQENEKYHYYFSPQQVQSSETKERLIRKYQSYYSAFCLDKIQEKDKLYDVLFQVDYSLNRYEGKLIVDMGFTYIHWKMAELIQSQKQKVNRFSMDDIQILSLCIFPKGNTVLHFTYKQLNQVRKLYQLIGNYNSSLPADEVKFEIPFLQNFENDSPLHLSIKDKNYKAADIFLTHLAETPLDSHSRAIVSVLPELVANGLPSFGTYMDKRLLQTEQLKIRGAKRGAIKLTEDLDYAVSSCDLWPDLDNLEKLLFINDPKESDIKLEFLDMPQLHSYSHEVGDKFFQALADTDDIELFSFKSIQALIDYKWPMAREYTVKILFIPFILFHINFSIYSNVFCGQYAYEDDKEGGSMWIGNLVLSALNFAFSLFFLQNEIRQVVLSGWDYFKSVWNYSDLLPPILIFVTTAVRLCIFYLDGFEANYFLYTVHCLACLLMWAKFLYFLRIFKSTGYLVRTLTDVCYDMKIFLLILFIVYFGFGEAFLRLSEKSEEDFQFIENYAMAWVRSFSGDLDTGVFDDVVQHITLWILWVIHGIITNIVMLNLLISIISDSFAGINEKAKQANYQERARIIAENSYLIPKYIKDRLQDADKFLIIATEVAEDDDEAKAIENQVKNIEDQISKFKEEINTKHSILEEKIDTLLKQ